MPVPARSALSPWLFLLFQSQHTPHHARNPLPILGLHRKLLLAARRDRVKLRLAVVVGRSPLRSDPPLLLQPQQRRVHRTLVQLQHIAADLLDPPRNPNPCCGPNACSVFRIIRSNVPCSTSDFFASVKSFF